MFALFMIMAIGAAVFILHLCAELTVYVMEKKGHQAKYWMGFFFGPLSWIYCIALPDLKIQKALEKIAEKNKD